MIKETPLNAEHFILKVVGKHSLVFKTRHNDRSYLEKVAKELLSQEDSHFTEYEIHDSDHANSEMTETEHPFHYVKDDLS